MRILHVSEAFGGGLRTAVVNYITATADLEHTVFARVRQGHETLDLPDEARFVGFEGSLTQFLYAARRLILDENYEVVHLHSSYAGLLRRILPQSVRIIYSPHCFAMETQNRPPVKLAYWAAEKFLSRRPQVLVAVSPRERDLGVELNWRTNARVIENAVVPESSTTGRLVTPHIPSPTGPRVISMTGRISRQKDPWFFAEVAKHFDPELFRFRWIGDGEEGRAALVAAGVEITGWLSPELTGKELRGTDLYLHTAAWEGGPLATLEAAAAGVCGDVEVDSEHGIAGLSHHR